MSLLTCLPFLLGLVGHSGPVLQGNYHSYCQCGGQFFGTAFAGNVEVAVALENSHGGDVVSATWIHLDFLV